MSGELAILPPYKDFREPDPVAILPPYLDCRETGAVDPYERKQETGQKTEPQIKRRSATDY